MLQPYKLLFWSVAVALLLVSAAPIFSPKLKARVEDLTINELAASRNVTLADEDGDHPDWIEIHNRSFKPVNMGGWFLTDDPNQPQKWPFPDISLGINQYLVIFASGKDRDTFPLHTNFKLSKNGEYLALYNILDNRWVEVTYPPQTWDTVYGLTVADGVYAYLPNPTPGGPNNDTMAQAGPTEPVIFSHPHGFYSAPFSVQLDTATAGAAIYYTLDGSEPSAALGTRYADPINLSRTSLLRAVAVKEGMFPAPVSTRSYIFLDNVLSQSNTPPPGFPTFDYEMDPKIVNHPDYKDAMQDGLKAIPSMSIVTSPDNYDIYANPRERGEEWERPVSVEMIYPDGRDGFQINGGLRIQGGFGRWEIMPKHSFRIFFDKEYGASQLEYPLFPQSPVTTFDTLILRGGVNRSYAGKMSGEWVDPRLATYTRDEWFRQSQVDMLGVGAHGVFVHLYLNGLYWGVYNLVERPDAAFMADYMGGKKNDWAAMNHSGVVNKSDPEIEARLRRFAAETSYADPAAYAAVQEIIDIPQYIDNVILNFYAGNTDWSDSNWYAGFKNPGGKIRFFVWDGELTWTEGAQFYFTDDPDKDRLNIYALTFPALMENPDFRVAFADRVYMHLFNNGALTEKNSRARWFKLNEHVGQAIVGESARWGDTRYVDPITRLDWVEAQNIVLAQMKGNVDQFIRLARELGYYPPVDPPQFYQYGGLVSPGFKLTMALSPGQPDDSAVIYYTTTGADPREPGTGAVSKDATPYTGPVVIATGAHLKARVLDGRTWSPLAQAAFRVTASQTRLAVSEIMYNPIGGANYEFIELANPGLEPVNLSNMEFEGINFTFSPNTPLLQPGQYMVLVNNAPAFANRYPDIPVAGVYGGRLANAGEELTLKDNTGAVVLSVAYDDENGWPVSPDGRGDSLVLVHPNSDPNDPKNWRASANINGSPGEPDPIQTDQ
jgi:hypothetical protein